MNNIEFKDFIQLQRGFDLPEQNRKMGNIPIVAATSIIGYHNEAKVKAPGVVTGRSGALGSVQFINEDFWPLNTTLWVKDFKGNNPKYVYYFLKTLDFKRFNSGAGVPTLNRNDLDTLQIQIHPYKIQCKIAKILSNYDNLIENNNKRIKILEDMAQKIYKEWFVDFKYPGHETVTFKDTELGKLVMPKKGKNITKATIKEGNIPVVAGGLEPAYYHNVANTVAPVITISASGANAGYVKLYYEDIWASDCSYIDNQMTPYVYYFYLYLKYNQIKVTNLQKGAAQPHVYPQDLASLKIFDIDTEIVKQFNVLVTPIFENIKNITSKNKTLRQTRDLLLPRLMSGEIDVMDLEIN